MTKWTAGLAITVGAIMAACGGNTSTPLSGSGGTAAVCTPGASVACVGPGGCAGGQVCKSDGSGFETCNCGTGVESGAGSGGSGASSGIGSGAGSGTSTHSGTSSGTGAGSSGAGNTSGSNSGTASGSSAAATSGASQTGTQSGNGNASGGPSGSSGANPSPCGAGASTKTVSYGTDLMPIIQANCSVGGTDNATALCHGATMVNMDQEPGGSRQYFGPPTPPTTATTTPSLTAIYNLFVTDATGKAVPSTEDRTMDIVDPGEPTKSFLWYKIDGTNSTLDASNACGNGDLGLCGSAMPLPLTGMTITLLPQADRDLFCNWIVQGAKDN